MLEGTPLTEETVMKQTKTGTEPVELVHRYVDSYNDRSLHDDAEEIFASDIVLVNEGAGLEAQGIEAYLDHAVDSGINAAPDGEVELVDYQVTDQGIAFTVLWSGTFTGDLDLPDGTIPGTGESFEVEFRIEATVNDGRITRWNSEVDMADFQSQVGLT